MEPNPQIDEYIMGVPAFAHPLFAHLRQLAHAAIPDGEETLKWGKPTFTHRGKNVATFAAFKHHAMFAIHGQGRQANAGSDRGKGRIVTLADLPPDADLLAALAHACRLIDESGTALRRKPANPRRPRAPLTPHPAFAQALAANPQAQAVFDAFPPSEQREYLEWIADAKRDETRERRIADAIQWLSEGKRRLWKYRKKG